MRLRVSRIKKKGESIQRKLEEDSKTEEQKDINTELEGLSVDEKGRLCVDGNLIKDQIVTRKNGMTENQNVDKTERQNIDKEKVTFYLPREITAKFNEVLAKRMMRNEKVNRSELICKAIDLLWKEEKTYDI